MITTGSVSAGPSLQEEEQPRAKLVTKDGKSIDYGTILLGTRTIERMEKREYVYTGEREGIYRIFREQ